MGATGAPTVGFHGEGERVIDRATGEEFICTKAGHPGTWVSSRLGVAPTVTPAANVAALDLTVSDPPEQAEVQAVADAIDEVLVALKAVGLMVAD